MSRTTWRTRTVLAAAASAVLVGTGVAALATTRDDASPASAPQETNDSSSAELRQSLDDLTAQADALEASLAATPTTTPTTTPTAAGVSDGSQSGDGYVSDGSNYDDDSDDSDDDDHGVEVEGDDD